MPKEAKIPPVTCGVFLARHLQKQKEKGKKEREKEDTTAPVVRQKFNHVERDPKLASSQATTEDEAY